MVVGGAQCQELVNLVLRALYASVRRSLLIQAGLLIESPPVYIYEPRSYVSGQLSRPGMVASVWGIRRIIGAIIYRSAPIFQTSVAMKHACFRIFPAGRLRLNVGVSNIEWSPLFQTSPLRSSCGFVPSFEPFSMERFAYSGVLEPRG